VQSYSYRYSRGRQARSCKLLRVGYRSGKRRCEHSHHGTALLAGRDLQVLPSSGFRQKNQRWPVTPWLGQKKKNPGRAGALLSAQHCTALYRTDGPCVFERGGCSQSLPGARSRRSCGELPLAKCGHWALASVQRRRSRNEQCAASSGSSERSKFSARGRRFSSKGATAMALASSLLAWNASLGWNWNGEEKPDEHVWASLV